MRGKMLPAGAPVGKPGERNSLGGRTMDDDDRDDEGHAQTEQELSCPYCGETVAISVDPTGGAEQEYVEDCPVCCQPWQVHVEVDADGRVHVWADAADE
jgi:hypothetical protein